MNLEGFSKRGMELGDDPEKIKETKNDLRKEYLESVKSLALTKIKNDLLFEGLLEAAIRRLTSLGLNVTRESILEDIQTEIYNQQFQFGFDFDTGSLAKYPSQINDNYEQTKSNDDINQKISELKNNLENIFNGQSVQSSNLPEVKVRQSFAERYDLEIKRLAELKKNNDPSYELELANTIRKLFSFNANIDDFREKIESDIDYYKIESSGKHR